MLRESSINMSRKQDDLMDIYALFGIELLKYSDSNINFPAHCISSKIKAFIGRLRFLNGGIIILLMKAIPKENAVWNESDPEDAQWFYRKTIDDKSLNSFILFKRFLQESCKINPKDFKSANTDYNNAFGICVDFLQVQICIEDSKSTPKTYSLFINEFGDLCVEIYSEEITYRFNDIYADNLIAYNRVTKWINYPKSVSFAESVKKNLKFICSKFNIFSSSKFKNYTYNSKLAF